MRAAGSIRRFVLPVVIVACAVYVPEMFWPASPLYAILTPRRLLWIGGVAKLACLATGAVYAFKSAARMEPSIPTRAAWTWIGAWLALWSVGQVLLMRYSAVLGVAIPVPSEADAFFFAGFAFYFPAQVRFVAAYRASGFPVGTAREHAAIALVGTAIAAAISFVVLAPIARTQPSLGAVAVNVGYPLIDLVAVVPTLVLLRIALAFRPGRVWQVWAALVPGFLFMAIGDTVGAYVLPINEEPVLDPILHLTYFLGYFFVACGAKMQHELLTS